jgi:hypothetical protein
MMGQSDFAPREGHKDLLLTIKIVTANLKKALVIRSRSTAVVIKPVFIRIRTEYKYFIGDPESRDITWKKDVKMRVMKTLEGVGKIRLAHNREFW